MSMQLALRTLAFLQSLRCGFGVVGQLSVAWNTSPYAWIDWPKQNRRRFHAGGSFQAIVFAYWFGCVGFGCS